MTAAKIQSTHCERTAYVYVRQSTPLQVIENGESTERQYHLRDRAIELGWPPNRVEIIDEDQGRSGSSAEHRAGFQRLVSEVGLAQSNARAGTEGRGVVGACAERALPILRRTGKLGKFGAVSGEDRPLLGPGVRLALTNWERQSAAPGKDAPPWDEVASV